MNLTNVKWKELYKLDEHSLKKEIFDIIQETSFQLQLRSPDDPEILGVIPRLADVISIRSELKGYKEIYSSLARSVGLWNYVDKSHAFPTDHLAAEIATIDELGIALHKEQLAALDTLRSGKNLILSAPTSFGKSILIDALLLDNRYNRVAVVLPTIALLDEFRRRFAQRFGKEYDILMHHSEKQTKQKVIFLGTQERLINRSDIKSLDLVVVDEFYKLDPNRKDERSITLNAAVYKLLNSAKQFFFLGPNIETISTTADTRFKFEFLRTRFSTVAVDTYDLKTEPHKYERLSEEAFKEENWPALIFVSSPDKANKLATDLIIDREKLASGNSLSKWIKDNYGDDWELSDAVLHGVGVHHGRIPRSLASRFIKLFNDKKIPILICTSTLIEGVNTAAKSVLIYDKKIAKNDFDFFTFSNIKGRAGRLGQHHIGQVFLFHNPPNEEEVGVTAPLFGNLERAPDDFVIHLDEVDETQKISERINDMKEKSGLTTEELRRLSGIGLEALLVLKSSVTSGLRAGMPISWTGYPTYEQIQAVCTVICRSKKAQDFGCASDKQLTMYISKLRSLSTLRDFFLWHSDSYKGQSIRHDNVFKFLRAAEYSLPEYFSAVELFVKKNGRVADYSLFVAELPRWFRPEELKILEEQGVPIQISERFYQKGDTLSRLASRLRNLAESKSELLSPMERQWVIDALP